MQLYSVAHFSVIKIRIGATAALLIAPILILMTEKWTTEQSCIHFDVASWKILSLAGTPEYGSPYIVLQ